MFYDLFQETGPFQGPISPFSCLGGGTQSRPLVTTFSHPLFLVPNLVLPDQLFTSGDLSPSGYRLKVLGGEFCGPCFYYLGRNLNQFVLGSLLRVQVRHMRDRNVVSLEDLLKHFFSLNLDSNLPNRLKIMCLNVSFVNDPRS